MSAVLNFPTQPSALNLIKARDEAAKQHAAAGLFFPVGCQPLSELTGMPDRGLQAVVRKDTNTVLAVHGQRYSLIKNSEVYERVDAAIRESDVLDTNGMEIVDSIAYEGGRSIRSYIFPEHKISIGRGRRDVTNLRLNVINSYDGSTNLRINMGGYRLVCANGMVVGTDVSNYVARHTSGFKVDEVKQRVAASVENFVTMGNQWRKWSKEPCSDEKAIGLISEFARGSLAMNNKLFDIWMNESKTLGKTMWAFFNALTYWSTHAEIKEASIPNAPAIVLEREARVSRFLGNPLIKAAA
ncbi:DUF932 domain-containing protein [Pseudoalteromonas sp. SCSIO 43088]|uniref:DUF932 domain-containing protein n=1 Tax=Pseudoalteromonas sp. SCSIO 43088 TaxID=2822846 RepID=UPI00202ADD6A|nr:DUF932 domain-containing protein [Pseudoalteromonas sp. SCSIO 43088]URQ88238.1 DUF932 domain-containing protein [Pseudoalteromonas sp. SCSIO 43088]